MYAISQFQRKKIGRVLSNTLAKAGTALSAIIFFAIAFAQSKKG